VKPDPSHGWRTRADAEAACTARPLCFGTLLASKQTHHAQVLVDIGPMNPLAISEQLEVPTLLLSA
jgi:hypothetical protein